MTAKRKLLVLMGLGTLVLAGCLVSATFIITLHINAFYSKSDGVTFEAHGVDLTTKQVWIDHQDDIKNISDVRFRATFTEGLGGDAEGIIYFSANGSYTDPNAVRTAADAFIVFSGLTIPGGSSVSVSFAESAGYRQNLDPALDLAETGSFYVYVLTPSGAFDLHVTDIHVMITFDAGPS